jgi:hypothetical protein
MKDIIISVDSTSHKVNFPDEFLGIGYENLQGNLIFQFDNNFIGGQARLDISIDCESGMIPNLTPYENGYILPIKSSLLTGSNVLMQLVIDETSLTQYSLTTDTEINPNKTYYEKVGNDYIIVENPVVGDISQYYEANTPVFKTDIFQLKVKDSINAQETIPEQYPTWINTLNTLIGTINQKLGLVDTALTEMNNLNINVSDKVDGEVTITFTDKQGNQKEVKINDGRGIVSILKTATSGNIDTYTITYTDNTTSTFEVTNGIDGTDGRGIVSIEKTGTTGLVDTYTITYTDNTTSIFNVANGKGITNIEKISTNLLVDTYRISFNDGTTQNYEVTNGKGIVSIEKTSTEGLTDIYTITYNDETTATFNVVNGKGIVSIEKTSTSGYVDTYTITYNDGTTSTYEVTNGEVSQAQLDALQDELNYYKTIINALPKITGTGSVISLNDTANAPMRITLGASELSQDGTPTPETPYEVHTITGDNTIVVCGRNKANPNTLFNEMYNSDDVQIKPIKSVVDGKNVIEFLTNLFHKQYLYVTNYRTNTQYTFRFYAKQKSTSGSSTLFLVIDYTDGTRSHNSISSNGTSWGELRLVSTANKTIKDFYFSYATGTGWYLDTDSFNIIEGDTTSYEPYQEQTAQVNLGDLEYCKTGNYADVFMKPSGSNIITNLINGSRAWGDGVIGDNEYYSRTDYIEVKPNTSYYIRHGISSGKGYTIWCYDNNKTALGSVNLSGSSFDADGTITTLANTKYIIANFYNETITSSLPMINEGSTELPYEPYNNGKWYLKKNIGKVVLDGINKVVSQVNTYATGVYAYTCYNALQNLAISQSGVRGLTKSNYFKSGSTSDYTINNYIYSISANIVFTMATEMTVEQANQWLENNNVDFWYPLATPKYLPLNDTLQSQLDTIESMLLSYKGQTNISQVNDDLPFIIDSTALKDLTSL